MSDDHDTLLDPPGNNVDREGQTHTPGGKFAPGNGIGHRFAKGNKHGKGNPTAIRMHANRVQLLEALDPRVIPALVGKLSREALEGDMEAVKVLLDAGRLGRSDRSQRPGDPAELGDLAARLLLARGELRPQLLQLADGWTHVRSSAVAVLARWTGLVRCNVRAVASAAAVDAPDTGGDDDLVADPDGGGPSDGSPPRVRGRLALQAAGRPPPPVDRARAGSPRGGRPPAA